MERDGLIQNNEGTFHLILFYLWHLLFKIISHNLYLVARSCPSPQAGLDRAILLILINKQQCHINKSSKHIKYKS